MKYDFGGYATKANVKCADGRTIAKNAFAEQNGTIVPLVWQHLHDDPDNVLGHALLENRDDGVYAYIKLNPEATKFKQARALVKHGDVTSLSIYANKLTQRGSLVEHGTIREVSLVLAGANSEAKIDNVALAHSDDSIEELDDEAIIHMAFNLDTDDVSKDFDDDTKEDVVSHADSEKSEDEETIGDVFNTLTEKQKKAVYAIIAEVSGKMEHSADDGEDEDDDDETDVIEHSNIGKDDNEMKTNVFDESTQTNSKPYLSQDQFNEIVHDAMQGGSFRDAFLAHAQTYGIENIDILFPDAKTITNDPSFIKRPDDWVAGVINGARHNPFSRIKSVHADITADEARALGYVKGSKKKEEVIKLLKRVTNPTTIYKKQKLDRDDILDITDLNVVAWLKQEMRMMLNEELGRAILIGDGRDAESPDKINEECIRPILSDDDMYSFKTIIEADATANDLVKAVITARKDYRGSGNPTFYTTTDTMVNLLLETDKIGRRLYNNESEVTAALRCSSVVEVPVMENLTYTYKSVVYDVVGIMINMRDYVVGADKGGEVNFFDGFDIDYNQYKYLLETRCSGALTQPKSAIVILRKQPKADSEEESGGTPEVSG